MSRIAATASVALFICLGLPVRAEGQVVSCETDDLGRTETCSVSSEPGFVPGGGSGSDVVCTWSLVDGYTELVQQLIADAAAAGTPPLLPDELAWARRCDGDAVGASRVFFVPRNPTPDVLIPALVDEAVAQIRTAPALRAPERPIVGLPTAFWVDPTGLAPHSSTGAIPAVTVGGTQISTGMGVTVTVAPTGRLFLDPGDAADPGTDHDDLDADGRNDGVDEGELTVCTEYAPPPSRIPRGWVPDCSHLYTWSGDYSPGGEGWTARLGVEWAVTWTAFDPATGAVIASGERGTRVAFDELALDVIEIQAVVTR
jgi:hypothetical protein